MPHRSRAVGLLLLLSRGCLVLADRSERLQLPLEVPQAAGDLQFASQIGLHHGGVSAAAAASEAGAASAANPAEEAGAVDEGAGLEELMEQTGDFLPDDVLEEALGELIPEKDSDRADMPASSSLAMWPQGAAKALADQPRGKVEPVKTDASPQDPLLGQAQEAGEKEQSQVLEASEPLPLQNDARAVSPASSSQAALSQGGLAPAKSGGAAEPSPAKLQQGTTQEQRQEVAAGAGEAVRSQGEMERAKTEAAGARVLDEDALASIDEPLNALLARLEDSGPKPPIMPQHATATSAASSSEAAQPESEAEQGKVEGGHAEPLPLWQPTRELLDPGDVPMQVPDRRSGLDALDDLLAERQQGRQIAGVLSSGPGVPGGDRG